jgi:hypothetical protein
MRQNLLTVFLLVKDKGPLWKGAPEVKEAGIPQTTFRDAAEELVGHGILERRKYHEGNVGAPRIYYEVRGKTT